MKICILCSNTSAFAGRIFAKQAVSFEKLGLDVVIIARSKSTGAKVQGICIDNLSDGSGYLGRLQRNISLFVKGWFHKANIWYCHELDSLVVGILLKFAVGGKVIFDCHEYFPEKKNYQFGRKYRFLGELAQKTMELLFDHFVYKGADKIVAVNEHMASRLRKRTGRPVFVVPNYPLRSFMEQQNKEDSRLPNEVTEGTLLLPANTLIYIGGLNRQRNIVAKVKALALLRQEYGVDVNLAIYGNGSPEYLNEIKDTARSLSVLDYVILGYVPEKDIPLLLKQAKVGLFLLSDADISHAWGEPIKFFEYAAAGLPVVFSDLPAKSKLIEKFKNGYVVDPEDIDAVASCCYKLLTDVDLATKMGTNGKRLFESKYNWEAIEPVLLRVISFSE